MTTHHTMFHGFLAFSFSGLGSNKRGKRNILYGTLLPQNEKLPQPSIKVIIMPFPLTFAGSPFLLYDPEITTPK
jgi:hypothetical protein